MEDKPVRKPISKKTRFEVFKRDNFTCQYCGASAPDVILEIDHIKPVSKGGTNSILNLVTSCKECNRGKTNKVLSDNSAVKIQKRRMEEINERREQLELMLRWHDELEGEIEKEIDAISNIILKETSGNYLNEKGRKEAKKLIRQFGFNEVYKATVTSFGQYYDGGERSIQYAWSKVGGICYNRRHHPERCHDRYAEDHDRR